MRRLLLGTAVLMTTLFVLGSVAMAFSCVPRPPSEYLKPGIVAAEGVVESSQFLGARVRLDRVHVGNANRTVTVWPARWHPVRGIDFPWTFYMQPILIGYVVTDCGGSHPGRPTQEEREVLGDGRPPGPDEPLFGLLGNSVLFLVGGAVLVLWRSRRRGEVTKAP